MTPAPLLVGSDLGTSSVKAVLTDTAGRVVADADTPYPLRTPAPGVAEQDPAQVERYAAQFAHYQALYRSVRHQWLEA